MTKLLIKFLMEIIKLLNFFGHGTFLGYKCEQLILKLLGKFNLNIFNKRLNFFPSVIFSLLNFFNSALDHSNLVIQIL